MMGALKKITPFLWYDNTAEQAAHFYCGIFANSRILEASAMSVTFELEGQEIIAFNGGPLFKFNEASSWMIHCKDQQEVDYYWELLTEGGTISRCGWLKDKYGLSWQVVPDMLQSVLQHPDPVKAQKAFQAMLKMNKLDIQLLLDAVA